MELPSQRFVSPASKRVDLDNDGSSDIIISASRDRDNTLTPGVDAGDYSLIVVQRALGDRVATEQVVGGYYPVAEEFRAPQDHRLFGRARSERRWVDGVRHFQPVLRGRVRRCLHRKRHDG